MRKEILTILEVSACGNRQAEKKLKFHGSMDDRIIFMFKKLLQKGHWDLISVRDIPWHSLKRIQRELGINSYTMYIHKSWKNVKEQWRYTCLSALFVLNGVDFNQFYTSDMFESTLRYVAGKIPFAGVELVYKTSHFPCVDNTRSHLSHQIDRKVTMLQDELDFQKQNQDKMAISSGDYNGGPCGDWYGQEQFDQFVFQDTVLSDTYEDKTIDHVFISPGLRDSDVTVKTEVLDDYYMQFTDHKIISITLEAC